MYHHSEAARVTRTGCQKLQPSLHPRMRNQLVFAQQQHKTTPRPAFFTKSINLAVEHLLFLFKKRHKRPAGAAALSCPSCETASKLKSKPLVKIYYLLAYCSGYMCLALVRMREFFFWFSRAGSSCCWSSAQRGGRGMRLIGTFKNTQDRRAWLIGFGWNVT